MTTSYVEAAMAAATSDLERAQELLHQLEEPVDPLQGETASEFSHRCSAPMWELLLDAAKMGINKDCVIDAVDRRSARNEQHYQRLLQADQHRQQEEVNFNVVEFNRVYAPRGINHFKDIQKSTFMWFTEIYRRHEVMQQSYRRLFLLEQTTVDDPPDPEEAERRRHVRDVVAHDIQEDPQEALRDIVYRIRLQQQRRQREQQDGNTHVEDDQIDQQHLDERVRERTNVWYMMPDKELHESFTLLIEHFGGTMDSAIQLDALRRMCDVADPVVLQTLYEDLRLQVEPVAAPKISQNLRGSDLLVLDNATGSEVSDNTKTAGRTTMKWLILVPNTSLITHLITSSITYLLMTPSTPDLRFLSWSITGTIMLISTLWLTFGNSNRSGLIHRTRLRMGSDRDRDHNSNNNNTSDDVDICCVCWDKKAVVVSACCYKHTHCMSCARMQYGGKLVGEAKCPNCSANVTHFGRTHGHGI